MFNIDAKTPGRIQPGFEILLVGQTDLLPATWDLELVLKS
jgi:hypothetical protein